MVLDKGLGLNATADLLATAGEYIKFVKFGWGTAATAKKELLIEKNQRYTAADIITYPGGTLLEIALQQNQLTAFFKETAALGFTGIEVSDGSTEIPLHKRIAAIHQAREAGFFVISEVGKKDPKLDHQFSGQQRIQQIQTDLEQGASLVIIEAREAGKNIGIYDQSGNVLTEELDNLATVGIDNLIFEAPLKKQQVALLLKFGPQINLGNITTSDAVSLATLRTGLRGDTVNRIEP